MDLALRGSVGCTGSDAEEEGALIKVSSNLVNNSETCTEEGFDAPVLSRARIVDSGHCLSEASSARRSAEQREHFESKKAAVQEEGEERQTALPWMTISFKVSFA